MAIIGPDTRAALRRFEASDFVTDFRVFHDRVRVVYTDGLREVWDLDGQRKHGLRLPRRGLWGREPFDVPEYNGHRLLDDDYYPERDPLFEYTQGAVSKAGWLDLRLLVHDVTARLLGEGYVRPEFPRGALEADLAAVLSDTQRYALSSGSARGQAGRAVSKPPPGFLLCLDAVNWGPLAAAGRPTLIEVWQDPRRLRWAVEGIVRRGQAITRAGVVRRLVCGRAEGQPGKAGPRWMPPSFWIDVFRDILRYGHSPIVLDAGMDCGARAAAVGTMNGVYLHSPSQKFRTNGPLWKGGGEIEPDDGSQGVDVALVDCANITEFEDAIEQYGYRADRIVGALPWDDREAALALRGVSVVRYRPRPYLGDAVLAVWKPS